MEILKEILLEAMFVIYVIAGIGLVTYGFNCYYTMVLFLKNSKRVRTNDRKKLWEFKRKFKSGEVSLPKVTTQLPVFNESNCIERLIDAVCAIDYPVELHQVQVLDDSTDNCVDISRKKVNEMKKKGFNIELITREDRVDYKAGALREGLNTATGEFIAIFDADFVPEKDFLLKTVPYMILDEGIGLVQGRWGHLNRNESTLTVAQSIGIDGHFVIEQSARSWGNLFMNFNGTAGVWRRQAIDDAGGWEGDTLTEDMDLSYRSQLAGWRMKFVFDVIVPAELPADINAFKSQQYRWAKGSIQTAKKILPRVFKADIPFRVKLHALMHTTHYMIHPLMFLMAVLAFPLLLSPVHKVTGALFVVAGIAIVLAAMAPSALYFVAQKCSGYTGWKTRMLAMPILMAIGVGIAVNNTKAVISALSGKKSAFIRTPKRGETGANVYASLKNFPFLALFEIAVGAYCAFGLLQYLDARNYLIGPFLALYSIGFLSVGVMSFMHYLSTLVEVSRSKLNNKDEDKDKDKEPEALQTEVA